MDNCTHNCGTCSGGCSFETTEGQKPRDILNELKEFVKKSESEESLEFFGKLAKEMELQL